MVAMPVVAMSADYYFQAELDSANAYISINGFPIQVKITATFDKKITPFLINGPNSIAVAYCPSPISNEDSKLTWSIVETPDGGNPTSKDAKRITEGRMGSYSISWPKLSTKDFTLYHGTINAHHAVLFQKEGNTVSFGGRLRSSLAFKRLPSRIRYRNLANTLTNVNIRFMKSGTPISVTFENVTLPEGDQTVDLQLASITSGAQWEKATGFDEILIEGQAKGAHNKQVMLTDLNVTEIQGVINESRELNLVLPHWHWQDGDRYTVLTEKDTTEIWQLTTKYHAALQRQSLSELETLLKDKMILLQQYLHMSPEKIHELTIVRFNEAISGNQWKLEPISPSNIRYFLINPQVVKVSTLNDDYVIRSVPPDPTKGGVRLRSELFFSHIGGKWVISQ